MKPFRVIRVFCGKRFSGFRIHSMGLVLNHFNEDLRWLKKVPAEFRLFVYSKGPEPDLSFLQRDLNFESLPNVGREAHTWLHHLGRFRDSLAPFTVFLQGHPFDHCHDAHARLRRLVEEGCLPGGVDFDWWGFIIETDDPFGERVFVPWSKNHDGRRLDVGACYRKVFGEAGPEEYRFFPGGQFAVSAEAVRRRSRDFYLAAEKIAEEEPDSAYCFERFWDRMFGAPPVSAETMGTEKTVYLKPIKRLG